MEHFKAQSVPARILYVSATGVLGGAERSLLVLLRAMDRRRFEPVVAVPHGGPLVGELEALGVEVFYIPAMRFRRTAGPSELARTGWEWGSATLSLARQARRRGVDLIHSNNTAAHLSGAPAARIAHVPAVWHVRDLHLLPALGPLLGCLTQGAVFVSHAVRRTVRLRDNPGLVRRTIPNAIDADAFDRAACPGALRRELGIGSETPLLVMAAQMVPWKRHDVLIRALKLLKQRLPGLTAAIAGEDLFGEHPAYALRLRHLVSALGLEASVRFLGYRDDVPTLMSDCDVVVVASEAEPFSRAALEAMALGRPVVGTAAGGLSEVVADGETGLLVPPGDPRATAEAIESILTDPALRRAMGEAGRRRVREHFSPSDHARRIARLYEDVLSGA